MPPNAGLDVELHLTSLVFSFFLPKLSENFNKRPFAITDTTNMMKTKKMSNKEDEKKSKSIIGDY